MKEIFNSLKFWITGVVLAVIIFFAGISLNSRYQSEVRILILPKSEIASRNSQQIIANAQEIPYSLSFYNKLVENNGDIGDEAEEFSNAKRKEFWNSKLKIKIKGQSGILSININDKSQWQAQVLSRAVAQNIAIVMSHYYNVKTDLDIRIIDGPIVSTFKDYSNKAWIFSSLILGFLISFAIGLIKLFIVRIPVPEKITPLENVFSKSFKKTIPEEEFKIEKRKPENPFIIEKKASAPTNLPTGKTNELEAFIKEKKEKEPKKTSREATPEEIKERLNRLLRGEM